MRALMTPSLEDYPRLLSILQLLSLLNKVEVLTVFSVRARGMDVS